MKGCSKKKREILLTQRVCEIAQCLCEIAQSLCEIAQRQERWEGSRGYLRYRARIYQGAQNFRNSARYIYTRMKKFKKWIDLAILSLSVFFT